MNATAVKCFSPIIWKRTWIFSLAESQYAISSIATGSSDVQVITKYFRDMENREKERQKTGGGKDNKTPAYIVFALDKDLFERSEFFKEVIQDKEYRGFSFIPAFENVSKECTKLVDFRQGNILIDLNDPDAPDIAITSDAVDPGYLKKSMISLSKINLLLDSDKSYSLPSMITFLEMYGVGKVEHLNPFSRWERNNPVKSLAVPIGIGTDGKLFTLDLHEKHQGPHG